MEQRPSQSPERVAEVVLRPRPVERHPRARIKSQNSAPHFYGYLQRSVVAEFVALLVKLKRLLEKILTAYEVMTCRHASCRSSEMSGRVAVTQARPGKIAATRAGSSSLQGTVFEVTVLSRQHLRQQRVGTIQIELVQSLLKFGLKARRFGIVASLCPSLGNQSLVTSCDFDKPAGDRLHLNLGLANDAEKPENLFLAGVELTPKVGDGRLLSRVKSL
jgi:hypothetical protein